MWVKDNYWRGGLIIEQNVIGKVGTARVGGKNEGQAKGGVERFDKTTHWRTEARIARTRVESRR
jgi:hypothetical protein